MRQNGAALRIAERGGEIDAGAQNAEDEGRPDAVTEKDVLLQRDGGPDAAPQRQIAEESGYSNTSHFIRQFSSRTGLTPSAYRRKKGQKGK